MTRRISKKTRDLKKDRWHFWKAQQLRSNWRSRAKKAKRDPALVPSREEIEEWLKDKEPWTCYLTNHSISKKDVEIDHIIPLTRGGDFNLDNVEVTSKRLNTIKGSMKELEFKALLSLVALWDDNGDNLFKRLMMSNNIYRRFNR